MNDNNKVTPGYEGYLKLHISPTYLSVSFENCQKAIKDDGILDELDFEDQSYAVLRCIYFLYGKNYWGTKPRNERVQKIKFLVNKNNGNFYRLKSFALLGVQDLRLTTNNALNDYSYLCRVYFGFQCQEGVVGGFPQKPFFYVQESHCGYILGSCSWSSVQVQRDMPEKLAPNMTLDVEQYVRRNLLSTDEDIDKRVVRDSGGFAFDLAKELTSRHNDNDFYKFDFQFQSNASKAGRRCHLNLEAAGPGLVSHFRCSQSFKTAGSNSQDRGRIGYWYFDGDYDCEGQFVEIELSEGMKKEEASFLRDCRDFCKNKICQANLEKEAHKSIAGKLFVKSVNTYDSEKNSSNVSSAVSTSASSSDNGVDISSTNYHAMVMLSGRKTEDGKTVFMLLNSWRSMPLVVVSAEYLKACEANVYFLVNSLTDKPSFSQKESCMSECSTPCFNDGGDVEDPSTEWMPNYSDGEHCGGCGCCGGMGLSNDMGRDY